MTLGGAERKNKKLGLIPGEDPMERKQKVLILLKCVGKTVRGRDCNRGDYKKREESLFIP